MSYREKKYEFLLHSYQDHVATVQFNNPASMNACNNTMAAERLELIRELAADPDIRVIVFKGNEKAFCAGGDLSRMVTYDTVDSYYHSMRNLELHQLMESMSPITIAAVSGFCLGGGMEFALACDLRIAAENAKFGQTEVNVGIFPGASATQRLVQSLPIGKAKEMILLGGQIKADEALRWGLVNDVVPLEQLMDTAYEWAAKLCKKPAFSLALANRCINNAWGQPTIKGLEFELNSWSMLYGTHDQKEGMEAFLNKRKPEYNGR